MIPKITASIVNVLVGSPLLLATTSQMLLKFHKRWKSRGAKGMYVLEIECNRSRLTKYLGI